MLEFIIDLTLGYNKIILPQPSFVFRGCFINLIQLTGRIAIDTTSTYLYSDYVWSETVWNKLNEFNNWRFYIDSINNFTSYNNVFNLFHAYSSIGNYNILIKFSSSNQIINQSVVVTDCKSTFIITKYKFNKF